MWSDRAQECILDIHSTKLMNAQTHTQHECEITQLRRHGISQSDRHISQAKHEAQACIDSDTAHVQDDKAKE